MSLTPIPAWMKLEVLNRDGWNCLRCGKMTHRYPDGKVRSDTLTFDHIIPESPSGDDEGLELAGALLHLQPVEGQPGPRLPEEPGHDQSRSHRRGCHPEAVTSPHQGDGGDRDGVRLVRTAQSEGHRDPRGQVESGDLVRPRLRDLLLGFVCWRKGCDLSRGQFCQRCGMFVP